MLQHVGHPYPVQAAAVLERVKPVLLGAEQLPLVPEAYKQLDAVQADWGESRLGGALAVVRCGASRLDC